MGNAPRRLWVRLPRSVVALLFFLAFGVGGLVLGCILFPPLMLFRARRAMRALVRACYCLFVWAARMTGMIRVVLSPEDRARFAAMRGRVVVASHLPDGPSSLGTCGLTVSRENARAQLP